MSRTHDHQPLDELTHTCQHERTRAIYEQRPPSEGRAFRRVGSRCEICGALLESGA